MKKNLFILAAAALAFTACSSDETIAVNEGLADANTISFRTFTNNMTRAAETSFSNSNEATQFKVTAYPTGTTTTPYFAGVEFGGDGSTYWVSKSNKYYWPSDKNLDFYAWAPASVADAYNNIAFTPNAAAASQVDFVYARTDNWGKYTGATTGHQIGTDASYVALNFRHTLSKIIVAVYNTNPNLKITVKDVTLGNVSGSGTFNIGAVTTDTQNENLSAGWTSLGEITSSYNQADAETLDGEVVAGSAVSLGEDMKLIPQTLTKQTAYYNAGSAAPNDQFKGAYVSFKIKIQNKADNSYIVGSAGDDDANYEEAMWNLNADTWNYGYAYTYKVDLSQGGYYIKNHDSNADLDPILEGAEIKVVTATVDSWDDGGTPSIDTVAP